MLHQCVAGLLIQVNEALMVIITARSSKYRFSIGFAVYRILFESLFLIEIASYLFFWRFAFNRRFLICDLGRSVFVEG